MSHSNSSLNCFANCMAKYEHQYVKHTRPCRPPSPHLVFGTMAHEVLYKAGCLRDEQNDNVADDEYTTVIPSEVLYHDLKNEFGIKSWQAYFLPIIAQIAEYEDDIVKEFTEQGESVIVAREVKLQITVDELQKLYGKTITQPLVGVIDYLVIGSNSAVILDYKFSANRKGQDEFDMNSQLPLYMYLVNKRYGIPVNNIKVGYVDIPKQSFETPKLLSNGTLSRAKSQNVSQELYEQAVITVHGDDEHYNCKPGGYYYDAWCNMAFNKSAYLTLQYIDLDAYNGIIDDLIKAAKMVDFMETCNLPFLKKYDSYSCKSCDYLKACKPWLEVNFNE